MSLDTLRSVLMRLRNEAQDGFHDVGPDGKFAGYSAWTTTSLNVTPEELDSLMELAGIVPDPIQRKGKCADCVHARLNGRNRAWGRPCSACQSPKMSNFAPITPNHQRRDHPDSNVGSCGCKICMRSTVLRHLGRRDKNNPPTSTS